MKALLDTNIVIHREAGRIGKSNIGILFKWLDRANYQKCIHQVVVEEINKNPNKQTVSAFNVKLDSYELLNTIAPLSKAVAKVALRFDTKPNDKNDTILLNELYNERIDILISEDRKIHTKASELGISERVFTIDSFLEKMLAEHPDWVNYEVLGVTRKWFGEINLEDEFFDSFREDYIGFDTWFKKKANDALAYITYDEVGLLSFLFMKIENESEDYSEITPVLDRKKRLKIGTFKVISNGYRLGERFLKVVFDNAMRHKVDEIYVTLFNKREEQKRLITMLEDWGFIYHGVKYTKSGTEMVYVRNLAPCFNDLDPKKSFPFLSSKNQVMLVPIVPKYHSDLLPDSYLKTESPKNFVENKPHQNAISKVYISRSIERDLKKGDVLIFYRTASGGSGYYTSVITTIGIVEDKIEGIVDEKEFILKCRKRSVFTDEQLIKEWNRNPKFRPFIINFLYVLSFPIGKRLNRQRLLELKVLTGAENEMRGLKKITKNQFETIIKETNTDESFIVS